MKKSILENVILKAKKQLAEKYLELKILEASLDDYEENLDRDDNSSSIKKKSSLKDKLETAKEALKVIGGGAALTGAGLLVHKGYKNYNHPLNRLKRLLASEEKNRQARELARQLPDLVKNARSDIK